MSVTVNYVHNKCVGSAVGARVMHNFKLKI